MRIENGEWCLTWPEGSGNTSLGAPQIKLERPDKEREGSFFSKGTQLNPENSGLEVSRMPSFQDWSENLGPGRGHRLWLLVKPKN